MEPTSTTVATPPRHAWPAWQVFVVVCGSYAVGSQLAYVWFGADGTNASFFPAAGVTLGALLVAPRDRWWVILSAAALAEVVVDLLHDLSPAATAGYTVANLAQPVLGVLLLQRPGAGRLDISRTPDLLRFLVFGVVVAPIAGAVLGATTHTVVQDGQDWARFALEWWAGDGLGILIVGGAILAWSAPMHSGPSGPVEAVALVLGTTAATATAFWLRAPGLMPIALALLMATAVRTRTRGVAAAGAGAGLVAAFFTAGAHRVWEPAELDPAVGLLYLQLAVAVTLGTALALAAEVNAREVAVAGTAALEAARLEQRVVGADDALLSSISVALQAVTTVEERRRSLAQLLHDHRGIEAWVEVAHDRRVPAELRPGEAHEPTDGAIERVLRARGREVGLLRLKRPEGGPPDLRPAFVDALAVRVGLAIENAILYERERDASHAFQAGLLGGPLPQVAACELGASYRSAGSGLEVGGDWHDAFELPDGRLALVVGDVVGKGLDAAIAMGQLRGAVRTLAPFSTPAEVLVRLDEVVANVPEARGSTLVYVEYDPSSGQLRHASAGHPPPVVVSASSGGARLLTGGRSTPLGFGREHPRSEARDVLAPRDLLVLYTDGLVERRSAGIDEGLARLRGAALRMAAHGVDDISDRLLEALAPPGGFTDDVCTLVVRAHPRDVFVHELDGGVDALSGCRAALLAWLVAQEASSDDRQGVVLAVDEAVSNCIEHGYRGRGGPVRVLCSVADGRDLLCVVRDQGRWLEPVHREGRGWGRGIMASVMDEVELDTSETGTEVRLARRLDGSTAAPRQPAAGCPAR
jgi:integral membrane sensor domain MASE1/anti-sigma regulatory factor (Ser/Thr protein kinase)